MSELFDGAIGEASDREQVAEEARRTREHHRNIGYKRGISEARQTSVVQAAFDVAFEQAAVASFCHSFVRVAGEVELDAQLEAVITGGVVGRDALFSQQLLPLYDSIKGRLTIPLMAEEAEGESGHYEYLPHTADIQIHAWGPTLRASFLQAGYALYDCMTRRSALAIDPACTTRICVQGADAQELLYNYLDELLFRFHSQPFLVARQLVIGRLDAGEGVLEATLYGESFDRRRHHQGTEVKAITTSNMRVSLEAPYDIYVIFDI